MAPNMEGVYLLSSAVRSKIQHTLQDKVLKEGNGEATEEGNLDYSNYNGVVTHTSSASVSDYFAQKLKKRKLAHHNDCTESVAENTDREDWQQSSEVEDTEPFTAEVQRGEEQEAPVKRKKKKRNKQRRKQKRREDHLRASQSNEAVGDEEDSESGSQNHTDDEVTNVAHNGTSRSNLKSCLKSGNSLSSSATKCVTFNKHVYYKNRSPMSRDGTAQVNGDYVPEIPQHRESSGNCVEDGPKSASREQSRGSAAKDMAQGNSPSQDTPQNAALKMKRMVGKNTESWNVTLKMAEKMSHYSAVMKSIPKHSILCTTNLLEIRGYGN